MNIVELSSIIGDIDSTIKYLRHNHLLKSDLDHCGQRCLEIFDNKTSDNWMFRCRRCRKKFSIRTDSIFSKSKLTLQNLLLLVYCFANSFSVTDARKLLKGLVSEKAIIQWYTYLREICSLSLLNTPLQLGSNGSIVQIDEAVIGAKRKYNRGYVRGITQWVFGMVDTTSKQSVLRLIQDRTAATLVPIIRQYCVPNAEVHSDEFASYNGLNGHGFVHRTVCHKDNFVSPQGIHTNDMVSYWGNMKTHFRSMNGTNMNMLPLHIDEYMYKHNNRQNGDMYDIFMQDIARFYPV